MKNTFTRNGTEYHADAHLRTIRGRPYRFWIRVDHDQHQPVAAVLAEYYRKQSDTWRPVRSVDTLARLYEHWKETGGTP